MHVLGYLLFLAACVSSQELSEGDIEASRSSDALSDRLERCTSLGFDADALDCKLCEDLSTFLKPRLQSVKSKTLAAKSLLEECQNCCSDLQKTLGGDVGRRFSSVVLGVSKRRLKRYPKVASFVEHRAPHMERVEVQEINPRLPVLQFFNEQGEKVEEVSVAHWDEDAITEFIEAKLLPEEKKTVEEEEEVERSDEL
ncbi:hypothetical protein BBJ29_008669 [Phytophthora kernoviae]|uniref:Selenoprotein F n=1 Tax=Phytophthora kernoviae TaxID=325452 RepID=A0A3F2RL94_9STRA|nr:hypothetical protein BBP00_00007092 [Phytophthora kernoviae]RLN58458.1 hypothetical protein BBJ29_008669 [Phytophthora kernoviae]